METHRRFKFQIIYGGLLILMGIGVFFRIPQVMPTVEKMESLSGSLPFIRFCFYLLGCLLIGGGIRKIHFNYKQLSAVTKDGEKTG